MKAIYCKDCKFFSQHYIKKGRRYIAVFCGHCLNANNYVDYTCPNKGCQYWIKKN